MTWPFPFSAAWIELAAALWGWPAAWFEWSTQSLPKRQSAEIYDLADYRNAEGADAA